MLKVAHAGLFVMLNVSASPSASEAAGANWYEVPATIVVADWPLSWGGELAVTWIGWFCCVSTCAHALSSDAQSIASQQPKRAVVRSLCMQGIPHVCCYWTVAETGLDRTLSPAAEYAVMLK